MNIAKHIAHLIKFHECVIIPDFGGFISNYKSAEVNVMRDTYSPPSKEVVFNHKINKNDGLLIRHLVENENITYNNAQNCVVTFVDQINKKLYQGDTVSFDELGSFHFDTSGHLVFEATVRFELIESYGLDTVKYTESVHPGFAENYNTKPAIRATRQGKELVKIAASVALVLTLSLFPFQENNKLEQSALSPLNIMGLLNETPQSPSNVEKASIEEQTNPYLLIGGSFKAIKNAKSYERKLLSNGYQTEIIELDNGYFRVAISSFATKEEAVTAMNEYRNKYEGSKAWVSIR